MQPEVRRFDGADALARAAAEELAVIAAAAVRARGVCHLALSGGSTPKKLFQQLVALGPAALPWDRIHLWWGDERTVPPAHADSNYGMTRAALLAPLGLDPARVHRIEGEADPTAAAAAYERALVAALGAPPVFDVVLLGMGPDGHTASLFPGSAALDERTRMVVANRVVSPLVHGEAVRITLTAPALSAARHTRFLVTGADKAATLAAVLTGPPDRFPSQRIAGVDLAWLVDAAAAAELRVILAGDTGGTKTVLALVDDDGVTVRREQLFHCAEYPALEAIVDAFVGSGGGSIGRACFGVAGRVDGDTAQITNLPWRIDARVLSEHLGGARVHLLNDLQATALGTLVLPAAAFAVLQPARAVVPHGPVAVIAPGTGLGEALLVSDGVRYTALASEGGHADLAPGSDEELALLRNLWARHGDHVSYERVLSGDGIGALYDFARGRGDPEPAWLTHDLAHGDRNATIAQAGLAGTDPACAHALDLFARILGAEAGNLALRGVATGGVVIGGGIAPKILPALQRGSLVARFNAKGRFAAWTATLGVRVALEPRAALLGAAHHAAMSTATDRGQRP